MIINYSFTMVFYIEEIIIDHNLDIKFDAFEAVVAADPRRTEGCRQALDPVPVDLQARGHDQPVVADPAAIVGDDSRLLGLELGDLIAMPASERRHHLAHRPARRLDGDDAAADECPQRLIVMRVRRLDYEHIASTVADQARSGGNPCRAAADHDDLMPVCGQLRGDAHGRNTGRRLS